MTTVFDGAIGAVRSTSLNQASLVLRVGEDCGTSRVSSRHPNNWHSWAVTGPMPPGYGYYAILRLAATNPVSRNLRDGGNTSIIYDSAGNIWTRASAETCLFEGGPSQYREAWYAMLEGALRPGDRITVKMPEEFSFDRSAAKASIYYAPFPNGYAGADHLHLSRRASAMMWWKGFETLLAHGINVQAIGQRLNIRVSVADEGGAVGDAIARMAPHIRRPDDVEAIMSGLLLLNTARRQRPSVREQRRAPPSRPAKVTLRLVK